MTEDHTSWQLQLRGYDRWLVLIPGWAFDERIFTTLDLPYNYLLTRWEGLSEFPQQLADSLRKHSIEKCSVLGWSLGAHLATEFARVYPYMVSDCHVVSAAQVFSAAEIEREQQSLLADAPTHLQQFYRRVFLGQKSDWKWFEANLLAEYQQRYSLNNLVRGLEYLAEREFPLEVPLTLWQGEKDRFASPELLASLCAASPAKVNLQLLPGLGHIPFLSPSFRMRWLEKTSSNQ